jgi:cytoskeletal protein CcmA (bactofilin family)
MTWAIILIVFTIALFILPLLPGIMELVRPTDIKPLRVSQEYDSNPYHFAEGFRSYIDRSFTALDSTENQNGNLENGAKYQLVGEKGSPSLDASGNHSKLILSAHHLTLPAGEMFETEIYGKQNVTTGERSQFRALLSDSSLNIREHSTVLRWAHSNGDMMVGRGCTLYGRATSEQSIILGEGVQFERLHAPIILSTSRNKLAAETKPVERITITELPDVKMQAGRRWLLDGALDFKANHVFDGDIVSSTTGAIGDWAHIKGSVKCNAHEDIAHHLQSKGVAVRNASARRIARCDVGNHVQIDGALVSSHDLTIGENCKIVGPVIAENTLIIGAGTVIGTPEQPTTVTAPHIIIESGCTVYGTLWATEGGLVRAENTKGAAA